ncbi:MAG: hypothetical protein LBQ15_10685 [Clostridium sp.]|jgi:hypothetical protein|nr:hypothetical protein [Clostridium sp.]
MRKKMIPLTAALIAAIALAACGGSPEGGSAVSGEESAVPPDSPGISVSAGAEDPSGGAALEDQPRDGESQAANPYLSITARRLQPGAEEYYIWDEVYYTFDLVTKELREICVLPHSSGYTCGVVSLRENAVYFSARENEQSNDRLCRYDVESGETVVLEDENRTYNDITVLDPDTLLVIASTPAHTLTPALFDLGSGRFTYMADVTGEPSDLYTGGPQHLYYNYRFDTFPWLYYKLTDRYSEGYLSFEEAIDHNFTLVSTRLDRAAAVFTERFLVTRQLGFMAQIDEKEVLVSLLAKAPDEDGVPTAEVEYEYYRLTFDGESASFVPVDNPFPKALYVGSAMTFDGGKTYYCQGAFTNGREEVHGLFVYDRETDGMTSLLSTSDGILGVANFRSVG